MIKTIIFIFSLLSIPAFSQNVEVRELEDEKGISILANNYAWYDTSGNSLSKYDFQDSLKTANYEIFIAPATGDTAKIYLVNKYPDISDIVGKELPEVKYNDLSGAQIQIGGNNKLSLLVFWDIHCSPCIQELVVLNILAKEFSGIEIYAITNNSKEEVLHFMESKNFYWKNIVIIPGYRKEDYLPVLKIYTYPACVIIDKNRIIKNVYYNSRIRQVIKSLFDLCP